MEPALKRLLLASAGILGTVIVIWQVSAYQARKKMAEEMGKKAQERKRKEL